MKLVLDQRTEEFMKQIESHESDIRTLKEEIHEVTLI